MPYCPGCGKRIMEGSRSCDRCGAVLAAPSEPSQAVIRSAPPAGRRSAPLLKRAVAGSLDLAPLVAVALLAMPLRRRGLSVRRLMTSLVVVLPIALMLLRDAVRGLSPGKYLMGLRTRDRLTGEPASVPESILRNLPLLPLVIGPVMRRYGWLLAATVLAVHAIMVALNRRGLTDLLGGTSVERESERE